MADNYDNNGYGGDDFKRDIDMKQDVVDSSNLNEKAGDYMRELLSEKIKMNQQKFPLSTKLIDQEVTKVQASGRIPQREFKYVDVFREKPMKVTVKVLVPVKEHPKYNFVGKLLGPKGNNLKQLQEETMCKMAILGRGSMRDKNKEAEARESLDPKYSHLSDELHVEISALAPPAEAHARIAYALAEVKKFLIPDPVDLMRGAPPMRDMMDRGGPRSMGAPPGRAPRMAPGGPAARAPRMPPMGGPHAHGPARPPKAKVFSILDRARTAMDTGYGGYDDGGYGAPESSARCLPDPSCYEYSERYYQDDYYKDDAPPPPARGYKSSSDVGSRRMQPPHARQYRTAPYARAPK